MYNYLFDVDTEIWDVHILISIIIHINNGKEKTTNDYIKEISIEIFKL